MKRAAFQSLILFTLFASLLFSKPVHAQAPTQITITISGIEYDDPNFIALREALKKNIKVKMVKPSYASGTASISCNYPGDATALWEAIPKLNKQFFKVNAIDDSSVSLEYTKTKTTTTTPTEKAKNANCFACDYFPMCNYDLTKSYNGKLFHGIRNNDNSIEYYYCENGTITKRWDYTSKVTRQQFVSGTWDDFVINYDDYVNGTASLTILKSDLPVGGQWESRASENSEKYYFMMAAKGLTVKTDGKVYKEVIKIYTFANSSYKTSYEFYSKNIGYIGKNLTDDQLPAAGANWAGVWKLVEENGRTLTPEEPTEYMKIGDDQKVSISYYQKKASGKLYPWSVPRPYEKTLNDPWRWHVLEQKGTVYYLLFATNAYGTNNISMDKKSVPQQTIIIGSKKYSYLGKDYDFKMYK